MKKIEPLSGDKDSGLPGSAGESSQSAAGGSAGVKEIKDIKATPRPKVEVEIESDPEPEPAKKPELAAAEQTKPETEDTDTAITPTDQAEEPMEADSDGEPEVQPLNISSNGQTPRHHRLWHWITSHKKVAIPLALLILFGILAALPYTRYVIAGTVIRKDFAVTVIDSQTNKPVTNATVSLAGKSSLTDSQGRAVIKANVGDAVLEVSKKYYKDASAPVLVPFNQKQPASLTLVATGRQVPVTVVDKVSGKAIENAKVSAQSSEVLTDGKGEAIIVLPANLQEAKGTVTAAKYNKQDVVIKVTTTKDAANTFKVTPEGKVYFLSNASGKIDVVSSNLDGSNRQTVLAGTGTEEKNNTIMFASTDWKYLALLSKREGDKAKVYLIETADNKLTTMDEGNAEFTMVGWNRHNFVYKVVRSNVPYWQAKHVALKTYDAESKKIALLDESASNGASSYYEAMWEDISNVSILEGEVVYSKNWSWGSAASFATGKSSTLNSVKQTAASKRVLKEFSSNNTPRFFEFRPYGANELYIRYVDDSSKSVFFEYEDGKVSDLKEMNDGNYYSSYPTYLVSPDGNRTFWNVDRDGTNALLVGDQDGKNEKQVGLLKKYNAYGWYTNDYLLVSKEGTELYIMPVAGIEEGKEPSKISGYYRGYEQYNGYGRGYGGY